jgi:4-deoxy-L-threo-5-hexosulose-uronate ketol-isomerase
MYSKTYYATSPRALHSATNEDLREQYLIDNLFSAGEIRLNYLHYERFVIGGVAPTDKPISLPVQTSRSLLKANRFSNDASSAS